MPCQADDRMWFLRNGQMSFWKPNCLWKTRISFSLIYLQRMFCIWLELKGGKQQVKTQEPEIEKWSCLSSNGPLNVLLIILEAKQATPTNFSITHTWECNGLKECQTLHSPAILGCCKANFSLFLMAIKRPEELAKRLDYSLKTKSFFTSLNWHRLERRRGFHFNCAMGEGRKKDDEFQCSKNERWY